MKPGLNQDPITATLLMLQTPVSGLDKQNNNNFSPDYAMGTQDVHRFGLTITSLRVYLSKYKTS